MARHGLQLGVADAFPMQMPFGSGIPTSIIMGYPWKAETDLLGCSFPPLGGIHGSGPQEQCLDRDKKRSDGKGKVETNAAYRWLCSLSFAGYHN